MSDGARTRDIPDHNRVLYQLSYAHHVCAFQPRDSNSGIPRFQSLPVKTVQVYFGSRNVVFVAIDMWILDLFESTSDFCDYLPSGSRASNFKSQTTSNSNGKFDL